MKKIDQISEDAKVLRERLVEKIPSHFGMKHLVTAFFGALFFGFSFMLNSLLFQIGLSLDNYNLLMITFCTWVILTAEIYFVGYTRVPDPDKRHFGQFWIKRLVAYYCIAIFTSFLLLSVYGITELVAVPYNVLKLVVAVGFPAAVGAAVSDLLGKY